MKGAGASRVDECEGRGACPRPKEIGIDTANPTPRERLESFARDGSKPLYTFLLRALGNGESAAEILQETLMTACRQLERYDCSRPFGGWVFAIGVNLLRNSLRRRRLERRSLRPLGDDVVAPGLPPEKRSEEAEEHGVLASALLRLGERQRLCVLLRYQEDHSCAEIGAMLAMTPNAVSIELHRARRELRTLLTNRLDAASRGGTR